MVSEAAACGCKHSSDAHYIRHDADSFPHRSDEDLSTFERTLPSRQDNTPGCSIYVFTFRYSAIPLRISSVCRIVHIALTGPKARQTEGVREELLNKAWRSLEQCWQDLDGLREFGTAEIIEVQDMERFIHGWQVSSGSSIV